jgi:hypothetical protein
MGGILLAFLIMIIGVSIYTTYMKRYAQFMLEQIVIKPHMKLEEILRGESGKMSKAQLRYLQSVTVRSKLLDETQRAELISKISKLRGVAAK